MADGRIPAPPNDIVVTQLERRPFRDKNESLRTPSKRSPDHYHVHLACVHDGDPNFLNLSFLKN